MCADWSSPCRVGVTFRTQKAPGLSAGALGLPPWVLQRRGPLRAVLENRYPLVLANPPFADSLDYETPAKGICSPPDAPCGTRRRRRAMPA